MRQIHNHEFFIGARKYLRHHMTKAEVLLWRYLKGSQLGFKFRRQQSIGSYIVDFYCPKTKLVIELDGESHGEKETIINDQRKQGFLIENNFTVRRYTNDQIFSNLERVLNEIKGICEDSIGGNDTTP